MSTARQQIVAHYENAVQDLVDAHAKLARSPLVLAIRYRLNDLKDVYLLEVIENFPGLPNDLPFTTQFEPSANFRIIGSLFLTLASPDQLRSAINLASQHGSRARGAVAAKKLINSVLGGEVVFSAPSPASRARVARALKRELWPA